MVVTCADQARRSWSTQPAQNVVEAARRSARPPPASSGYRVGLEERVELLSERQSTGVGVAGAARVEADDVEVVADQRRRKTCRAFSAYDVPGRARARPG